MDVVQEVISLRAVGFTSPLGAAVQGDRRDVGCDSWACTVGEPMVCATWDLVVTCLLRGRVPAWRADAVMG